MRHRARTFWLLVAILIALLVVSPAALGEEDLPFERTEDLEPCGDFDKHKQPYFGATHLHTGVSFDASIRFVPATPRLAYAFAKGESPMPGVGPHGLVTHKYHNPRPLDWGAVTDHSEHFGEVGICKGENENAPGYNSLECQLIRGFFYRPAKPGQPGSHLPPAIQRSNAKTAFALLVWPNLGPSSKNTRLPLCTSGEGDCEASELRLWQEMQNAAKEAYEPCKFSSFIGYEVTSTPAGTNWHRNVIFRNADVPHRPVTALDMAREENPDPTKVPPVWLGPQVPQHLWDKLWQECQGKSDGKCDALTIPHNSNLGGGVYAGSQMADGVFEPGTTIVPPMFFDPIDREDAEKRQYWEPLVEIYQDKGSSECRWDPRIQQGVETTDEHCAFELLDSNSLLSASGVGTTGGDVATNLADYPPRSWVRNVLKDGLKFQQDPEFGVNPFKLGIVASSDSHDGTMGWHPENETFHGHLGIEDFHPTQAASTIQNSSGGHSVVWAEENTRDAIFTALRNKETYGTSGTRPVVRFFGGWDFSDKLCEGNFVETGYQDGVPMGGDLPKKAGKAPRFVTAAWMDEVIGTPLQQVQVIKGWVDAEGNTHEKVITVAGGDREGNVNNSCERTGEGYKHLCSVWEDPDFDPAVPSFYYVRVLENPVCRYSTHICQKTYGVNPLDTSCANQLLALQESEPLKAVQAAYCCSNETTNPILQPVIQERAWTSPIWYTPE